MSTATLSLGDLIQEYRAKSSVSLSELARRTNVNKGTISKIENGDVRRPDFRTVEILASQLNIPFAEYVERYIVVELRPPNLFGLFEQAVAASESISTITKIAMKYMETEREDSYDVVERVYLTTATIEDNSLKLALYKKIVEYARDHGMMPFIAKGLYQQYLIERDDFNRLQETYQTGTYILNYSNLLSPEERIITYYKLAIHAYTLRLYEDCISLGNWVIQEDTSDSRYKIDCLSIVQDSHFFLGNYMLAEKFLLQYQQYNSDRVPDNVRLLTAMLDNKKGNSEQAVMLFQECLEKCKEDFIVYVVNQLMMIYVEANQWSALDELLQLEERIKAVSYELPPQRAEVAGFYKLKGDYCSKVNRWDDAVDSYMEGAYIFAQINDTVKERECMKLLFHLYRVNLKEMDLLTIQKIEKHYECCDSSV